MKLLTPSNTEHLVKRRYENNLLARQPFNSEAIKLKCLTLTHRSCALTLARCRADVISHWLTTALEEDIIQPLNDKGNKIANQNRRNKSNIL